VTDHPATDTTSSYPRALLSPDVVSSLRDLDGNGVDYTTLGLALHVAFAAFAGCPATAEAIGEEDHDGSAVDALNDLLTSGYVVLDDNGDLVPADLDSQDSE